MAVPLLFRTPLNTAQPVELLFVDPQTEIADVTVTASATLPAPTLSAIVGRVVVLQAAATLPAPVAGFPLGYDNAVFRGFVAQAGTDWQQGSKRQAGAKTTMEQGAELHPVIAALWGPADRRQSQATAEHTEADRLRTRAETGWEDGDDRRNQITGTHAEMLRHIRPSRRTRFEEARQLGTRPSRDRWIDLYRDARPRHVDPWQVATPKSITQRHGFAEGVRHRMQRMGKWQEAMKPPPGLFFIPPVPPEPDRTCYDLPLGDHVALLFDTAAGPSPHLVFLCRGAIEPPGGATVVVPIRRAYIVINDVHLRRVSNNLELPCYSLSLNIDADSWTWGFNASLPASCLPNIEPAGFGDPVELDAEINGAHYRLLVENIARERQFPGARINVSGRGKSAILADPYSPIITRANEIDRNAQQLMADILTTNGVPIGWSVDWQVTDWLVPAGVFSHTGSYMSALNAIAGAIGGYIQPHPTLDALRVLNRYPVAPWEWASVTPDFELPSAAVSKEGIAWADRPNYNAVWLSGHAGGVLTQVRRTGTAGDIIAPMVADPLLTRADAHRQRGISILGNTGRIATVTLELPALPETGIIEPGKFVLYTDGGTERLGLVRGTSVSAQTPAVRQSLEVECHA